MKTRRLVLTALLTACALAVNVAEGALPSPAPGIKLGAANVFSLAALVLMGAREAYAVTLMRVALAWLAAGNVFALFCGLAGGLAATSVMALVYKKWGGALSLPWISVAGAWAFNIGQVAAVAFMAGDRRVALYVLPLFIAGSAAGWAVGWLADKICARLEKTTSVKGRIQK